jgi:hypothetical protein
MTAQDLFLGLVLAAFGSFAVTLFGVHLSLNLKR